MLNSLTNTNALLGGLILAVVQIAAALPWLRALDPKWFARTIRDPLFLVGTPVVLGGLAAAFLGYKGNSAYMPLYGRIYGAALHAQLVIDLFIYLPLGLIAVWPKGGAVAYAAFREGWRQPMFWVVTAFGLLATWVAVVLPYFTFGDDYKMMKQIGFDIVMLCGVLFGVLASSISISEEIEGRTAITLLSKPVTRRQFLVGKFAGILMACGLMSLLLAWNLSWALFVMPEFDPINKDRAFDAMPAQAKDYSQPVFKAALPPYPAGADVRAVAERLDGRGKTFRAFVIVSGADAGSPAKVVADGAGMWFGEAFAYSFHVAWGFGQVMILVAVATALATRLPFVVNVVVCLVVYFLGHLAPVVVKVTDKLSDTGSAGVGLIRFLGNLFDTLLPALEFFNHGPAIIRDTPLELPAFIGYVATVLGYSVIYSLIALVVGLLLFEDRDLA